MAKGVKFGGGIDVDYWKKEINKTKTVNDARNVLEDVLRASYAGTFNIGVTDNDQKNIMTLVNQIGTKYGVNTSGIAKIWDPSKNHINSTEVKKAVTDALSSWDSAIENKNKQADTKTTTTTTTTPVSNTSKSSGVSYTPSRSSSGGGSTKTNDEYYQKKIDEYQKKIDELVNPKVWTADELAELYGLKDQYNYDKILSMYNDATNKYYDDAIKTQLAANSEAEMSNAGYANNLLKSYLSGYSNAAPTAIGRGTLAANALSTMLGADESNEASSANLNSIVNSYREARNSELANNATTARTQYNDIGKTLLNAGAKMNTADVQNYINALNAYDTAYSGLRNAQNNLASTAASQYQNNAQAALANNSYNNANAMAKYYQAYYGNNNWPKAYRNVLNDEAIKYGTQNSAN